GSGGTSLTACAAISDSGGEVTVISRGADDNYDNIARHCDADIIVNTTPLGTCPNMDLQAVDLSGFKRCSGVVDVVYNPLRSRLVLQARELGIRASGGLPMLVSQAKEASSVFEGCEIADSEVERIISVLTKKLSNIVLIGMPGCGKTTVGALVAKRLSRAHVDIDSRIVEEAGMSVGGIFEKFGEEYFRKLEEKAVFEAGKEQGIVISTGGGAAMSKNNRRRLSHNGIVVLLKREVSSLEIAGRPLSADTQGLIDMERKRMPVYRAFADIVANNNGKAENTAEYIAEKINENTCY
ncbi:MAG: shikimate kinase, partial [Oscillospiraceae bacterium]